MASSLTPNATTDGSNNPPDHTKHHIKSNKRLRKQCVVTPWQDFFEFDCVGTALLGAVSLLQNQPPSSQMSLEEGLQKFAVWKARCARLPHAVESTGSLAQIVWRDQMAPTSSTELRSAYACTILRAINGLADVQQQQRATATSVALLCSQMGIPPWLVDIRHESTHQQLPTLPVLRKAALTLLEFFRKAYWDPVSKATYGHIERATELLKEYHALVEGASLSRENSVAEMDDGESSSSESEVEVSETKNLSNVNSFAALQQTSSSKTEKRSAERKPEREKKKRKTTSVNTGPSPSSCARAFVKLKIPLELAHYAILSFLIWTGVDGSGGVLLSFSKPEGGAKQDFEILRKKYTTLLQNTCRAWPGFLSALLVHFVDAVMSIEDACCDSKMDDISKKKLSLVDAWIRYVLSKNFLAHAFPNVPEVQKTRGESDLPPVEAWQSLRLPLNSLCDRCEEASVKPNKSKKAAAIDFIVVVVIVSFPLSNQLNGLLCSGG